MNKAYQSYFAIMVAKIIRLGIIVGCVITIMAFTIGHPLDARDISANKSATETSESDKPSETETIKEIDDTNQTEDSNQYGSNALRTVSEDALSLIISNDIESYEDLKAYTDGSSSELEEILGSYRIGYAPGSSVIKITNDDDDYCDIDLDTWDILGCTA